MGYWCLATLLTIFELHYRGQFYLWRDPKYREKTTNLPQAIDNFYHLVVWSTHRRGQESNYLVSGDKDRLHLYN